MKKLMNLYYLIQWYDSWLGDFQVFKLQTNVGLIGLNMLDFVAHSCEISYINRIMINSTVKCGAPSRLFESKLVVVVKMRIAKSNEIAANNSQNERIKTMHSVRQVKIVLCYELMVNVLLARNFHRFNFIAWQIWLL